MFVLDQAIKDSHQIFDKVQTKEDLKIANLASFATSALQTQPS